MKTNHPFIHNFSTRLLFLSLFLSPISSCSVVYVLEQFSEIQYNPAIFSHHAIPTSGSLQLHYTTQIVLFISMPTSPYHSGTAKKYTSVSGLTTRTYFYTCKKYITFINQINHNQLQNCPLFFPSPFLHFTHTTFNYFSNPSLISCIARPGPFRCMTAQYRQLHTEVV